MGCGLSWEKKLGSLKAYKNIFRCRKLFDLCSIKNGERPENDRLFKALSFKAGVIYIS
jgi:hypothetical protein